MKPKYIKYAISLTTFVVIIVLHKITSYNFEHIRMILLPTMLLFLKNKDGLLNDLIFSIASLMIIFLSWMDFSKEGILLALSGSTIAFFISRILAFICKKKS